MEDSGGDSEQGAAHNDNQLNNETTVINWRRQYGPLDDHRDDNAM